MRFTVLPPALMAIVALGFVQAPAEAAPLAAPAILQADTVVADTVVADTLRTRADSIRARVLDRLQAAPVPGARPSWLGSAADTIPDLEIDPDSLAALGLEPRTPDEMQPPQRTLLPMGADSMMQALSRLPGYRVASFEGVRMEYTESTRVLLLLGEPAPPPPPEVEAPPAPPRDTAAVVEEGVEAEVAPPPPAPSGRPARFSGEGIQLEADSSIVYDDASGLLRTRGSTVFKPERGDPVISRTLIYDLRAARGTALGAQTRYAEGFGEWFVESDMDSVQDGVIFGSRARFTSDDRPQPNSHFEASELKVVANDILVARSVRLHFQEVPVFWLPFLVQPLQSGRSSGILTPQFSVNDIVRTSGNYERRLSNVGLYWAISDYADATLAGDWWSGQYTALTSSLRYSWGRQFLAGELAGRHFWRESGQRDLAISASNNWEPTERGRVSASGNYVSNTGLVRQNSLDPRELTASINSQAGLQQRFDWGSVSLEARRQQYLTDDRVEMTLPSATLSLATFTLFPAGAGTPRWYNNMTVGASSNFGRDVRQPGPPRPDEPFRFSQLENIRTQGSVRSSISLANLSMSGNASYRENAFSGVPDIFARPPSSFDGVFPFPLIPGMGGIDPLELSTRPLVDYADAEVNWSASLSYQQRIIGTTSISPSLTLSGQFFRSDSIGEAQSFVESPARIAFGMSTQAELYGFFPGFGEFDLVRHKVTPSASFSYAPEVDPTELQVRVFGARALGVQKVMTVGFNQTFEARRRVREPETPADEVPSLPGPPGEPGDPDLQADPSEPVVTDPVAPVATLVQEPAEEETRPTEAPAPPPAPPESPEGRPNPLDEASEGFSQPPPTQVVTLLGLSTSSVTYDLVQADSTGRWIDGFTTTELRNSVSSDYLRGLSFSFSHLLFEDPRPGSGGDGMQAARRFSPHLTQVGFGFSLDDNAAVVRALGRFLGLSSGEPRATPDARGAEGEEGFEDSELADGFDVNRVLPGLSGQGPRRRRGAGMDEGSWSANLNYSLRRPRESIGGIRAQMLNGTISFRPTELLALNWATAYDFEANAFTDHTIRVTRDMYDWEASFGFRQAVNGNWTFQFEVSLKANRDLRFDYEQRNLDGGSSLGGLPGGFF